MTAFATLYREVKDELQAISGPLMDFAAEQVTKHGGFLPFGATLTTTGAIALQAAAPEEEPTTSEVVLPLLVTGLVTSVKADEAISAVAACEWVKIGLEGGALNDAIKVQVHHRRGIAVAFYLSAKKRLLRGWEFGDVIAKPADALIDGWPCERAA